MSRLARALSMQQVDENLGNLHINERDIRALLNDIELSSISHKSHQMCFTRQYFCQTLPHELTTNQLVVFSELNARTVRKDMLRGRQEVQVPGRHRALNETSESEPPIIIIQAFNEGKTMRKRKVLELVRGTYSTEPTKDWLNAFV
jgi:hypothetical protein